MLKHEKSRRGCRRCKERKVKCDQTQPTCSACSRHGVECVYAAEPPPRLGHKKSRNGCHRCKEHKIKCDETHPVCSACQRRGVECHFPSRTFSPAIKTQDIGGRSPSLNVRPSSSTSAPEPETPYDTIAWNADVNMSEDQRRPIELFLLHRYATEVARSIPSLQTPALRDVYPRDAIELGFQHPFLLHAIFAFTALYFAVKPTLLDGPHHAEWLPPVPPALSGVNFTLIKRFYLNLAVQKQREALSNINESNADALGLTAMLLALIATHVNRLYSDGSAYTPPVQWLHMSRATFTVICAVEPHLNPRSPIKELMSMGEPDMSDSASLFKPENAEPFRYLLDFKDPSDDSDQDPETTDAYAKTLAFIGSMHMAHERGELPPLLCRRITVFSVYAPPLFLRLLEEKRTRAIAIFSHYAAMAKWAEQYWWYRGAAELQLTGIQKFLPQHWQWALKWPLEVVGLPGLQSV
ncbi:hypothetical protein BDV97DRAFT_360651 [Delphinella strobiligena]|nr:hypothetical protein BDV97DRAFT_360651 [Delphinella strobiligena]